MSEKPTYYHFVQVNKPNKMILAGQKLSAIQLNILYTMLKNVQQGVYAIDEVQKINFSDFSAELKKTHGGATYNSIRKECEQLLEHTLKVQIPNTKKTKLYNIVTTAEYELGSSCISVEFSPKIIPIIIEMSNSGYTKLILSQALQLKSRYSKRLYEYLTMTKIQKRHMGYDFVEIEILFLRFLLGIDKENYREYKQLRRWVIDLAFNEINEKTSLCLTYSPLKEGRTIYAIRVLFGEDKKHIQIPFEEEPETVATSIPMNLEDKEIGTFDDSIKDDYEEKVSYLKGFFASTIKEICKEHSLAYIKYYHRSCSDSCKKKKIDNFPAYLFKALRDNQMDFYTTENIKLDKANKHRNLQKKANSLKELNKQEHELAIQENLLNEQLALETFNGLSNEEQKKYYEAAKIQHPYLCHSSAYPNDFTYKSLLQTKAGLLCLAEK